MLPHMPMREVNKQLSIINRVVIHPKYRTIGLGTEIIRETLALSGTPWLEMVAVMAKYNPFAEKAGLQKVTEQKPTKSILAIAALLSELGFNLQLLSSGRYVSQKLDSLSTEKRETLKELFIKNKHPRFEKEFAVSRHQPFGKTADYVKCIENADSERMVKLIKLVGMLLQTKVYLFWSCN
jgi:ABC-type ATPase with predicted acetyltransferase domain